MRGGVALWACFSRSWGARARCASAAGVSRELGLLAESCGAAVL